jgi:hypothetical protein
VSLKSEVKIADCELDRGCYMSTWPEDGHRDAADIGFQFPA